MLSIDPDDDDDVMPVPSQSTQGTAAPEGQAAGDAADRATGGTASIDLTGEGDANSSAQRVSSM